MKDMMELVLPALQVNLIFPTHCSCIVIRSFVHSSHIPQWPSRLARRTYKQYWLSNAKVESSILSWGISFSFFFLQLILAFCCTTPHMRSL